MKIDLFAKKSFIHLWGCNLGNEMASVLAKFVDSVRACKGYTSYDFVLTGPNVMPTPADPALPFEDFTAP